MIQGPLPSPSLERRGIHHTGYGLRCSLDLPQELMLDLEGIQRLPLFQVTDPKVLALHVRYMQGEGLMCSEMVPRLGVGFALSMRDDVKRAHAINILWPGVGRGKNYTLCASITSHMESHACKHY